MARKRTTGFSLLEMVIVLAIVMVIMALAVPRLITSIAEYKLHSGADGVAAMMLRARMTAVQNNRVCSAQTVAVGGATMVFVDANNNFTMDAAEARMVMPQSVGFTTSAPAVPAAVLGFTAQPATTVPRFTPRGLPCAMLGGTCSTRIGGEPVGFVYYLQATAALGPNGLAAVAVNPSGHAQVLTWSNSTWH